MSNFARFLQIHTLVSYPAALLNRDDSGLAKRLPYGGASRIRISSQCLKRHWRKTEDDWSLAAIGAPIATRSRELVERQVLDGVAGDAAVVEAVRVALVKALYGEDNLERKKRQALLLGQPELDYLTGLAKQAIATGTAAKAEAAIKAALGAGKGKMNLTVMRNGAALAAGLEAALFGRMVTSDPAANTDAAIHVEHAFTVHAEESETDYFTVVDDLSQDAESGSAGMFETEITSGLFYGYVVVDIDTLVKNLGGDRDLAGRVVEHLLHLIATVSPGAKKGSTAPYAYADLMLVEAGRRQPRSLAGAFRKPVSLKSDDLLGASVQALGQQLQAFDTAYGAAEERSALCTSDAALPGVDAPRSLDAVATWAADAVRGGSAAAQPEEVGFHD
jgi:CRISPR system Cascade subunit CasC